VDPIEAHVRRLPALDDRWVPKAHSDEALAEALLAGGVAGTATHPLDNVRGNILLLLEGDPDKQFGLGGLQAGWSLDTVLDLVAAGAGAAIDLDARHGPVDIRPEPALGQLAAMGNRLAEAAARRETVVLATGHPVGLALLYRALDSLVTGAGARVLRPAHLTRWRQPGLDHDWVIDHWGGVGMLTDGREPRHTHRPDAMERMLAEVRPDVVVGDHGFAGAAIGAGVETLSIADVNDPALLIAKAQGRTDVVVVMDDHVAPDAYWPCFQAVAARFPSTARHR
jgi:hypothetical protein